MVTVADFSHLLIAAAAIVALLISISPIRRIVDSETLTLGQKVYWVVVVLVFPILGAIAWWVASRQRA